MLVRRALGSLAVGFAVAVLVPAVQAALLPAVAYPAGAVPTSVAVGDFDGDGAADLAVANNTAAGTVSVLLGNGDGTFQPPVPYPAGFGPLSVAVGDFDGDGAADLAVANNTAGTVSVLLGNGDGTFRAPVAYPAGVGAVSVAVGDLDGDGAVDLAVANPPTGAVSVLLGNGDGTFQAPVAYAAGGFPFPVVVGDLDSDGAPDLAVANPAGDTVSVLLGNGDGTFQVPVAYAAGGTPFSVAIGDLDGDGAADLAVANNTAAGTVSVLLGNGDGTFRPPVAYPVGSPPVSVAVGDLDSDGVADLAVADESGGTVSVLAGNGDGTFQAAVAYPAGSSPVSVVVGDFNGDGAADLAAANNVASGTVSVLLQALAVVSLAPASHDFGSVVVGAGRSQVFTLANNGNTDLTVSTVSLAGAAAGQFAIVSDGCSGQVVPPGGSCSVTVLFGPSSTGVKHARLVASDDAPGSPESASLTGRGIAVGAPHPCDPLLSACGAPQPGGPAPPLAAPAGGGGSGPAAGTARMPNLRAGASARWRAGTVTVRVGVRASRPGLVRRRVVVRVSIPALDARKEVRVAVRGKRLRTLHLRFRAPARVVGKRVLVTVDTTRLVVEAREHDNTAATRVRRGATVRCRGGSDACRARVSLAGGASNERVTIELSDTDLRLVSVRPSSRSLRGAYEVSGVRFRSGGSEVVLTLNAVEAIPPGSYLTFTFRAPR